MTSAQEDDTISITVEFTGGLEILFGNRRRHRITLPAKDTSDAPATIAYLIDYLCQNVMQDSRRGLFIQEGTVRPGILVLINDADWELEGEEKYLLQDNDCILFVSTLHGG